FFGAAEQHGLITCKKSRATAWNRTSPEGGLFSMLATEIDFPGRCRQPAWHLSMLPVIDR
ncbi:MAG TPA: hypothetical protein VK857_11460, partial [Desulforhopalus sp.]|nr:hypothetical protein [Desulforhopalus sp.]